MASIALAMGVVGCGQDTPAPLPGGVTNLLARAVRVDAQTDTSIAPTKLAQWGDHSLGGWRITTDGTGTFGTPSISTFEKSASLALNSTGPASRKIELQVFCEGPSTLAHFDLNGIEVGSAELTPALTTLAFSPPPAVWIRGKNRLTLRLDEKASDEAHLGLAEVSITPAESVQLDATGVRLDPGTAVSWRLELASTGLLDCTLRGPTQEASLALISLVTINPLTGAARPLEERTVSVPPGAATSERLLLPDPNGQILEVRVTYEAETGAQPLRIEKLDLFEDEPLERPPILFISIDTLAAQSMSLYGYERETTPHLKDFAKDSVLFNLARSNAPWTLPSYASQFTGQYARANRNTHVDQIPEALRTGVSFYQIAPNRWTLSEMLEAAGYRTSAIVDNLWLAQTPGFDRGFDSFDAEPALAGHGGKNDGMRMVLPKALEQLELDSERPPFVFAQILDVHGPYLPNAPYRGHFSDKLEADSLPKLPIVRGSPGMFGGIPDDIALGRYKSRDMLPTEMAPALLQADYDEKVLELDATLGEFFDDLKARGLYDDLLIIFSADHGESMTDHDFNFHHGLVYDSAIHVPLVIKLPHQEFAGSEVNDPVQLVDLYPTLADLIGLPATRPNLQGRSLLPLLRGKSLEPTALFAQGDVMESTALSIGNWKLIGSLPVLAPLDVLISRPAIQARLAEEAPELMASIFGAQTPPDSTLLPVLLRALKTEHPDQYWQLGRQVYDGPPMLELYDTGADPEEATNLIESQPEVLAHLTRILLDVRAETLKLQELAADTESEATFSSEMLEELQRLGYTGDE